MEESGEQPPRVEAGAQFKALIREASQALARLDAGRLEELAHCCEALTKRLPKDAEGRRLLRQQAQEAAADWAVFAHVLDATRANLNVMNRLRELRMGRLEYSERLARGGTENRGRCGGGMETGHGNH